MTFFPRCQRTLLSSVAVEGFGYWSGKDVRVEFHPAEVGTGLVFVRKDLSGNPKIPVSYKNRLEASHRTCLALDHEASVGMVEHILAALTGMWVDNCEIHVTAAEMPGMDGSASIFVDALESVGFRSQRSPVQVHQVNHAFRLEDGNRWLEISPLSRGVLRLAYELDYGANFVIGHQHMEVELTPEVFKREIAPARTFVTLREVEILRASGLAQRATEQDLLVFGNEGPINNKLRFPDECVRHKLLDLIGDLSLTGGTWSAAFTGFRSGHDLNYRFVRQLMHQEEKGIFPFEEHVSGVKKPVVAVMGAN
ncbi:MAG: UDP-3-O-acyl-N-acetylglucosamine deacetylase [Planctomycetia bacterium]|nr:UDP-3-O-acyl-N-acetylglucosamine deacetylase [Planctomycetia bacterium]